MHVDDPGYAGPKIFDFSCPERNCNPEYRSFSIGTRILKLMRNLQKTMEAGPEAFKFNLQGPIITLVLSIGTGSPGLPAAGANHAWNHSES
jgi:hypothetical protein